MITCAPSVPWSSTVDEQVSLSELEATATEFLELRAELGALAERVGARPSFPPPERPKE